MDHKRINKLIKKISNLNASIEEDGDFSSIEKEHMLNYIKKLFEEVKAEMTSDEEIKTNKAVLELDETEEVVEEEIEEVIEEVELIKEELEEEIIEEDEEEIIVEDEEEIIVEDEEEISEELLALFDDESGNELSDKLAQRPIKDLTKAMSINERIFTVNELFGGNKEEFENMMVALDGLGSFDEAKNVLIGSVADKYEWASIKKTKKASGFIKLVRRRFNS